MNILNIRSTKANNTKDITLFPLFEKDGVEFMFDGETPDNGTFYAENGNEELVNVALSISGEVDEDSIVIIPKSEIPSDIQEDPRATKEYIGNKLHEEDPDRQYSVYVNIGLDGERGNCPRAIGFKAGETVKQYAELLHEEHTHEPSVTANIGLE